MKELKIETGGRPYRNEDFELLQTEHVASWNLALADHVATITGKKHGFVLSGCQLSGGNLTAGLVYLNGRLLRVAATSGVSPTGFLVMQSTSSDPRLYKNGVTKDCLIDYVAAYTTAEPVDDNEHRIALNSIRRLIDLQTFRPKVVAMWTGDTSDLPHGVQLCDGTNGTPDLRQRFLVGIGDNPSVPGAGYSMGAIGGADQVTLTEAQLPAHTHTVNDPGHSHTFVGHVIFPGPDVGGGGFLNYNDGFSTSPATTGITIQNTGGGQAHENRPPYYALAFVTRVV